MDDRANRRQTITGRRRLLQAIGVTGVAGLAGCLGDDTDDDADDEANDDDEDHEEEAPAFVTIDSIHPEEVTITVGDSIEVRTTVSNTGDLTAEQDIVLTIGDDILSTSEGIELAGGSSAMVMLEITETSSLESGEYPFEIASEDDAITGTLIVEAAFATLIEFSRPFDDIPNGAWTWFTGERAMVDSSEDRIFVGSVSAGGDQAGDIVVSWYDLSDNESGRFILHEGLEQDDHNNPALYLREDGHYLAKYAAHGSDSYSRWRISEQPHDPTSWQDEQTFDNSTGTTYSNVYHLPEDAGGDGRTYSFVRTDNWDPNVLISDDEGLSWEYGGRLVNRSGDRPYPRYTADDETIHFIVTEEHPRSYQNSIYHGAVRDGVLYDSTGEVLNDAVLAGSDAAPDPSELTTVFASGTEVAGVTMTRAWTIDIALDESSNPVAVFIVRAEDDWHDHRFFYARLGVDGWRSHEVMKAGQGLYDSERDYTGLAAIDPDDPTRVVFSTPIDPESDEQLDHHELFLGTTPDHGESWEFEALTPDSPVDNLRPLIPDWNDEQTALIWMQGDYHTWRSWNSQVVGIADQLLPVAPEDLDMTPDPLAIPYGVNFGGEPEEPQSSLPVVIDGLEYETVHDYSTIEAITGSAPSVGSGTNEAIDGTEHDALYQTSIFGEDLTFDVYVEAGPYDVTLHFAEVFHDSPGERVFDVLVQDEVIETGLDIVDAVGDHTALTITVEGVEIADGPLTVSLPTQEDYSLIRGFAIR